MATDGKSNLTIIYRALTFDTAAGMQGKEMCSGKDSDGYTYQLFFMF